MKANVGVIDSSVRMIAGFALVILAVSGRIGAWGWLGVVPIVTGVIGFCPLYRILHLDTCGNDD